MIVVVLIIVPCAKYICMMQMISLILSERVRPPIETMGLLLTLALFIKSVK